MSIFKILDKALINEESIVISEVKKWSTFKFLGDKEIDLYIFTSRSYVEKIIKKNLTEIRISIEEIDKKSIRNIYINNIFQELIIKELHIKKNLEILNIDSLKNEKNNEFSGENDIVGEMFKYESSFFNKKVVTLIFYNKYFEKEYKKNVETKILKKKWSIQKRKIINEIEKLLALKYEPNNNDTKEIIEYLQLK